MKLNPARESTDEIAGVFDGESLRQKYLDSMEAKFVTPWYGRLKRGTTCNIDS